MLYYICNYYSYCNMASAALHREATCLLPQKVTLPISRGREAGRLLCRLRDSSGSSRDSRAGRKMVQWGLFLPFDREGLWHYGSTFEHWQAESWSSLGERRWLHTVEVRGASPRAPSAALPPSRFFLKKCIFKHQVLGVFRAHQGFCVLVHPHTFWNLPAADVTKKHVRIEPASPKSLY